MKRHFVASILVLFIFVGCDKKPVNNTQSQPLTKIQKNTGDKFDSNWEEPYVSMTRTIQLLDMLHICGWSLAHIKQGEYTLRLIHDGQSDFIDQQLINEREATYLFIQYAQIGDDLSVHAMNNKGSATISMKSPFTSAPNFRKEPIPSKDGEYTLVESYDNKGKIVLYLKGTLPLDIQFTDEKPNKK